MQSVMKKDIENGMTYVSVMKDNLAVLTEALQ
jgi:ABC-type Zn uptake system ZnuABC Zn-binding protein ZnuA